MILGDFNGHLRYFLTSWAGVVSTQKKFSGYYEVKLKIGLGVIFGFF